MTLARQLITTMSVLVLVTIIGVEFIHLRGARQNQQNQLESLAQDAATSLALSLGSSMRELDPALAETIINPAFDRGHYRLIEFVSATGGVVVRKTLSSGDVGRYPDWFANVLPLHPPTAESFVTAGWRQLGKLRVQVHPRFAYEQLWQTARGTFFYLLVIYVVGLVLLRLILTGILKPLAAIERAAVAISDRNFVTIDATPATRELARVVEAMNALSRKVRDAIAADTMRAAELQRAAYEDEVSGLLNRRGLIEQFDNAYGDERDDFSGTFAIAGISGLAAINDGLGGQRCDALLRGIAGDVNAVAAGRGGYAARWAGAQFALVLPGVQRDAARALLASLRGRIALAFVEAGLASPPPVQMGAVCGQSGDASLETLAAAAQELLDEAATQSDGVVLRDVGAGALAGAKEEASLEQYMVDDLQLVLVGQDALALPGRERLHTEIMARVRDANGALVPASRFMEILSREGLTRRLDEMVVESVGRALSTPAGAGPLAINLSARSLDEGDFINWLAGRVERLRLAPGRLTFEVSEHGVVQNEAVVERLAAASRRAGAGFAIDHFGVHRSSIALLPRFKPAYLKLAGLHTTKAGTDAGTRLLVEAIVRAARQLDVAVIAQNVENEAQLAALASLGIAGYQGYLNGAPAPWPPA